MSAITPNETSRSWHPHSRAPTVQLYLADGGNQAASLVGARVAGFTLAISPTPADAPIDVASLSGAAAAIVEVSTGNPQSVARFQTLAKKSRIPLVAVAYDPPLALVRALVRAGAHDVVPLPLDIAELEASLAPIRDRLAEQSATAATSRGKLVTVIKSVGGVGATTLLSQLAIRFAQHEAVAGREACLLDLDVQFGDAAFQLGLRPSLSLVELLEAGSRLDGDLLRATTTTHRSGLKVIASPPKMLPLESLSSEQLIDIVDSAAREFGTLFIDLPTNWTNWSLSLLARSDVVLLITELSIASLHRARRQLDLIEIQELDDLNVRVVVNRHEKGIFKTIRPSDVRNALGRDIAFTIANDYVLVRAAVDRGIPISEVKRKSAVGKDIDTLDAGIAAALGLER
jgi:pilus assembly protein CpaE